MARPVHTGPLQASLDGDSSSRVSYQLGPAPGGVARHAMAGGLTTPARHRRSCSICHTGLVQARRKILTFDMWDNLASNIIDIERSLGAEGRLFGGWNRCFVWRGGG